jgi:hypothetical protein
VSTAEVIDTTHLTPAPAAQQIAAAVKTYLVLFAAVFNLVAGA